jgi:site-specific recombinase XerD
MGPSGPVGDLAGAYPPHLACAAAAGPGMAPAWLPVPALPPGRGTPWRWPAWRGCCSALPHQGRTRHRLWPLLFCRGALGRSAQRSDEAGDASRGAVARLAATDDRAAVREWIATRAGSAPTAVRYEREAERWMLWIITERGRAMSAATALDCRLYMDHLANLPEVWISRRKVARWAPGWGPFRGPLSVDGQAYAVHVLHSLYEWLVQAGYLAGNPWVLVNRRKRDAVQPQRAALGPASRAFTPSAWAALRAYLDASRPGPSVERLRWLCTIGEATGLRAAELLRAEVGHLQGTAAGWVLVVVGKGGRARVVPVPHVAMQATRQCTGCATLTRPGRRSAACHRTCCKRGWGTAIRCRPPTTTRRRLSGGSARWRRLSDQPTPQWVRRSSNSCAMLTFASLDIVPPSTTRSTEST